MYFKKLKQCLEGQSGLAWASLGQKALSNTYLQCCTGNKIGYLESKQT